MSLFLTKVHFAVSMLNFQDVRQSMMINNHLLLSHLLQCLVFFISYHAYIAMCWLSTHCWWIFICYDLSSRMREVFVLFLFCSYWIHLSGVIFIINHCNWIAFVSCGPIISTKRFKDVYIYYSHMWLYHYRLLWTCSSQQCVLQLIRCSGHFSFIW